VVDLLPAPAVQPIKPDVTVATLIMRPILGEMCVAMLPALDKRFTTYTLEMESAAGTGEGSCND
jgi:hypothetical protein